MYCSIAFDLGFVCSRLCKQNGDTALHLAIQHGHEKVVTMLLKDGKLNVGTCNKVSGTFYAYFLIAFYFIAINCISTPERPGPIAFSD